MARGGLTHLNLSDAAILSVAASTPRYDAYAISRLELLEAEAKRIFRMRRKGPFRPSPTSPPRYEQSFVKAKVGRTWWLINNDPGALWVEFGAHAGGRTLVLKYRPLGLALDSVSAGV